MKVVKLIWYILLIGLLITACKRTKTVTTTPAENTTASSTASVEKPVTQEKLIPLDPDTKTGKLENGLTYYIRKNAKPENYAELRLAVDVGSIVEEEDQLGLAHFTEHMCFNGTKNFPKSDLVDYLESIGTRFGAHLNAFTSFDETVYMLKIPTDNADQFNKGFQILGDWAYQVTFDEEEINKERGVVISEWRTRQGASNRMSMQTLPKTFYNSHYADRLPIGTVENLETFKPESLTRFYKKWYQPDIMCVVAVGDFDIAEVEAKIKETFGAIPKPQTPTKRPQFDMPAHDKTLVAIATDEEASYNQIGIEYKHPVQKLRTEQDYRRQMIENLVNGMINERIQEIVQGEEAPFTIGFAGGGNVVRPLDLFQIVALVPEGGFEKGWKALIRENLRIQRHGFAKTELERAKQNTLTRLERASKEKDKTESNRLVMRYVMHFLKESPAPGIDYRLAMGQKYLPAITVEEVNAVFNEMVGTKSIVVSAMGIDKEGAAIPTEENVRSWMAEVEKEEIPAYEDKVSDSPLLAEMPKVGRLLIEKEIPEVGVVEFKLSNGIKVWFKQTDFKNDEIRMSAFSPGGTSLYPDSLALAANFAANVISSSGLGEYDNIQLDKYLTGKVASASPYIGELYEGVSGVCSPKDMEVFFQMVHMYFTQPRKDQAAFNSVVNRTKTFTENSLVSPSGYFRNEVNKVLTNNHPRAKMIPSPEELDQLKLDDVFRIYQERFADASDFQFVFVGNYEIDEIRPFVLQYIASLPGLRKKEQWKDVGIDSYRGVTEKNYYKGKEPKSQVILKYTGDFDWEKKDERFYLGAAVQVLSIMMRESLREDKGGVYGVGVYGGPQKEPRSEYSLTVSFTCDPGEAENLISTAKKDIKNLQENGPSEKNMVKIKETMKKDLESNLKSNRYWLNQLSGSMKYELDPKRMLKQEARIEQLNAAEIQRAAKEYFNPKNAAQFILYPESSPAER